MNPVYSLLLGLLQGATEFLPISSSAHLLLAELSFGLSEVGLTFDVALHLGTLAAVLVYFRKDFIGMAKALLAGKARAEDIREQRLFWYIVVGTVPAVGAALFFGDFAEAARAPLPVAATLIGGGILLLVAEKFGRQMRDMNTLVLKDVLLIGLCQALALMPGVSRSGITMTACLLLGLNRSGAVRFSFLLSAPVILGAGVYHLPDIIQQGFHDGQAGFFMVGFLSAAISGYLVIAFLLQFVRTRSLVPFAYYRFVLAGAVLAATMY